MAGLVGIDITKKLPATAVVGSIYKIEGNVKIFGAVGAPPFVYARVRRKEWYKPEIAEETSYNRGWPIPITGSFTVDFQPEKDGNYQVSVLASPAPISLPAIGVFPTLFESDAMKVDVGKVSEYLTFSQPKINGTTFTKVRPGDKLTIICSITSTATTPITATGKVSIYQGAFWSTPGDLVETLTVPQFTIEPNETIDIKAETTADSEITSKDIQLSLLQDSTEIESQRFQDAYSVEAEEIAFDLSQPTATPSQVSPGATVNIACPVKSRSTKVQNVTAKFLIYEGSVLPTHGTLLDTKSVTFSISPGQTYNATVSHTAVAGTIDRRDVGLQIIVNDKVMAEDEWDDVFYVTDGGNCFRPFPAHGNPIAGEPRSDRQHHLPRDLECPQVQTVTAKFLIYEGSILPDHGTLLDTKSVTPSISPDQDKPTMPSSTTRPLPAPSTGEMWGSRLF